MTDDKQIPILVDHLQVEILKRLVRAELYTLKKWQDTANTDTSQKSCDLHIKACVGILVELKIEEKIYSEP